MTEAADHSQPVTPNDPRVLELIRRLTTTEAELRALLGDHVDMVLDPTTGAPLFFRETQQALLNTEAELRQLNALLEQRVAERTAAVRESEQRLRLFIEHAPAALAMFDRDMRYMTVSRRWLTDYHLTDQNIIGKSHYEVFPEISGHWKDAHRRALRGETVTAADDCFQRSDGTLQWLRWELRPWYKVDASIGGIIMFTEDITALHNNQERLQQSEQRLARAQAIAHLGSWELDLLSNTLTWSAETFRIFGVSPQQFTPSYQAFLDLVHPEDRAAVAAAFTQSLHDNQPTYDAQHRIVRPSGEIRYVHEKCEHFRDAQGRVVHSTGMTHDITEYKRNELELRASEERFRVMFESHRAMMLLIEPDTGAIIDANKAAVAFYGHSRAQLRKMRIDQINQLPAEQVAQRRRAAVTRRQDRFTFPHRLATGELRWVEVYSTPVTIQGKPQLFSVIHDVTERVQAEQQIRQLNKTLEQRVLERTAELTAANRELEGFTYTVAHDLRAPLRHVLGFIEILRRSSAAGDLTTAGESMQQIQHAAKRMTRLVDDLLEFARLSRTDLLRHPVNLADIVAEVRQLLEPELDGRQIQWQIGTLPTVTADRAMLRQVFYNLLHNAIKFTRPQPVASIEIGSRSTEREHVIFIRDNGVGFDMQYADKLFGVFQRLHDQREFEGTGIGLAHVQRIIQRHGGRAWAESQPHQGTTVYFTLPHTS